jgi:hypothetical protein
MNNDTKTGKALKLQYQFEVLLAEKDLIANGIDLAKYPWDECIADQTAKYESEETAKRICGYIKSQYGS